MGLIWVIKFLNRFLTIFIVKHLANRFQVWYNIDKRKGKGSMEKKRARKIVAYLMAVLLALMMRATPVLLVWSQFRDFYTDSQHLARIQRRAEWRFLGEGSAYTGLTVYPLYSEEEEFDYALIELQPQGFMYVRINDTAIFEWLSGASMYTMSERTPTAWRPYRIVEGKNEYFKDENGYSIWYSESHFKVAGIEDERRYLLRTATGYIPAVKRGEQYLDLVDGELIDYDPNAYSGTYAGTSGFIPKFDFNL